MSIKKDIEQLLYDNTYARLPEAFFSNVTPQPFNQNILVSLNSVAADLLELDIKQFTNPEKLAYLTGQIISPDMKPIAQCYAGHQFGSYVPRLGDGRAILLGEVVTDHNGKWDLQIKGSGLTPYSRNGDGRAVLRSTIREYLCSEAMFGLGIESSRALCIIGSNEEIYRERIEPGAMLLRLAPSHVRFGTFEYFYHTNNHSNVKVLADYVIASSYRHLAARQNKYLALLQQVIDRTAKMIALWQAVGFSHGVMNSDNMSILGLTLDYGPFGFMQAYDPGFICNHSDHTGRYAFDQQPAIGLFNLSCLAQAMLPLFSEDPDQSANLAKDHLAEYQAIFTRYYASLMRRKLGLVTEQHDDQSLLQTLLNLMAQDKVDYTILFRRLCDFSSQDDTSNNMLRDLFIHREAFDDWASIYKARLSLESIDDLARAKLMKLTNPKYVLRNYMCEIAIRKAEDEKDYSEIDRLLSLVQSPYEEQVDNEIYAGFPPSWAEGVSVSCSS